MGSDRRETSEQENNKQSDSTNWLAVLGPGILFASTAIGVSHLVQSTRAGALVGFGLLWAVIAANVAKYPFFEFGSRYASATGQSLIEGYRSLGKGAAWTYLIIASGTCFFVMGAVGIVTAAFLDNLFGASARLGLNATPGLAIGIFTCATRVIDGWPLSSFGHLDQVDSWRSPPQHNCRIWGGLDEHLRCRRYPLLHPTSPRGSGAGLGIPDCSNGLDAYGGRLKHLE